MARSHVPKFGAWDIMGPTFTAAFDKARAAKGGKMINPNDPAENPDLAAMYSDPASAPPQGSGEQPTPHGRNFNEHEQGKAVGALHVTRPRHARRASRENLEDRRSSPESAQVVADQVQNQRDGGRIHGDGNNEGSRHTLDRASQVGAAPEVSKANPSTPPRNAQSRASGVARVEEPAPRRGSPLPGFGNWNTDPSAVEEYSEIFNQHRNEKKMGEVVRNTRSNPSPARNCNKSHKLGTSSEKDKCLRCTIL